jgi:MFS family permease
MSKKQLLLFSLVLILIFGNGSGFVTLIPVHLSRLGIAPDKIGYLFSLLYFGMASSGILAGWSADRFGQHKLMCILSAAGEILASLLMLLGSRSFPLLAFSLFLSWFLAGIHAALVSTLIGLQAQENERGRVFGITGFITGLGPVISGFLYGKIVDNFGFETLLSLNVAISVLWMILSLFYQSPPTPTLPQKTDRQPGRILVPGSFYLVVAAATLGWFSINGGKLGITLVMTGLEFSADDISLTVGVASLVALAVPLFLGLLSDYSGRKPLLLGLNFLGLTGLFLISRGQGLSEFCVASSLLSLYSCFSSLSNALVTDLLPKESLGFGLSLINSTSFIAGIFSSALFGLTLNNLGPKTPFLLGMLLPLTAALLLAGLKENRLGTSFLKQYQS